MSDVEHVLLRPNTYLGSIDETESEEYIFHDDKFSLEKVSYVPGLLKIINEIIDNAVDEGIRTKFEWSNKIKVDITKTSVEIKDNGRGIPIQIMEGTTQYIPEVIFTSTKAGSNFSDDNRITAGTNGLGSTICVIFSKLFRVITHDGKKRFVLTCKDNLSDTKTKITDSATNGTEVYFEPDFARFRLDEFSDVYAKLVYQRLIFLSHTYPEITFWFNGEKIHNTTDKKFINYFIDNYEVVTTGNATIAVGISNTDDFKHLSYVNGLFIRKGGNHIQYISNEIVQALRTKLEKKYKTIRPADIRNKLYVFTFFKNFPNMRFDSQTKETLSNSVSEVKQFLSDINLEKLSKALIKNEEIFFHIEENFKIKEEFLHRKEIANAVKPTKIVRIENYLAPIGDSKYCVLTEGDSAKGGISAILGRQDYGYFPLRGKPLNVHGTPIGKIAANEELKNVMTILGLDISKPIDDMNFQNVLIASDQDLDGFLIRGGLLAFFNSLFHSHFQKCDFIKDAKVQLFE
ncbi:MAG: hypothetical protein HGA35_05085 [Erysipelotrichaceae bacterium]|nr:hypothetical protein [Erysipelotrichaceae bacterium]